MRLFKSIELLNSMGCLEKCKEFRLVYFKGKGGEQERMLKRVRSSRTVLSGLDFSLLADVKFPGNWKWQSEATPFWILTAWVLDWRVQRLVPLLGNHCCCPGER